MNIKIDGRKLRPKLKDLINRHNACSRSIQAALRESKRCADETGRPISVFLKDTRYSELNSYLCSLRPWVDVLIELGLVEWEDKFQRRIVFPSMKGR